MEGRRWGMPDGPAQRALKELEEQNEVKLGDAFLVRIPQLEGKISMRTVGPHQTYVDYICESWYDQERKQMRNRKKVIGQVIESIPGAMLPNENYYKYFDRRTGEQTEIGAGAGPDTGDSSGVRLDTSPDAQNRPPVRTPDRAALEISFPEIVAPDIDLSALDALAGLPEMIAAAVAAASVPVSVSNVENKSVEAPVNINVTASGADPRILGQSIYYSAQRYLQKTLQSALT